MADTEQFNGGDNRSMCKYGDKCYQKNPQHRAKFKHPSDNESANNSTVNLQTNENGTLKKRKSEEMEGSAEAVHKKRARLEGEPTSTPQKSRSPSPHISPASSPVASASATCSAQTADQQNNDEGKSNEAMFSSEEEELAADPATIEESIQQKFLVKMPRDFYKFWQFCKDMKPSDPLNALSFCGITLVGTYDVVAGTPLTPRTQSRYLCHWRYYHDPPELQTVVSCGKQGYHIGYFRDSPSEDPVFLASMSDVKPGSITPLASNIFDAVRIYCQEALKAGDLFKNSSYMKLIKQLEEGAKKFGYKLDTKAEAVKSRKKRVVSRSFHGAGIVVPVDKTTEVGYRDIPETDASLRRMLQKVVDAKTPAARTIEFGAVQELMTNAQWATDEGDFGMGLELGMDLFINGSHFFHKSAQHLMTVAYSLLDREHFSTILKAHLNNRRKGNQLSAFNLVKEASNPKPTGGQNKTTLQQWLTKKR